MITNRIDSLSPSAQLVLKVASVIGRTFSYDLLIDIFPVHETKNKGRLKQYLLTLTSAGLIQKGNSYNSYVFKHTAIVECCYNLLLPSQRQQLHQVIAEWYETHHKEQQLHAQSHLLAHHWLNANKYDKALGYVERAGERALNLFANVEAVDFFTQAIGLVPKVDRKIESLQRAHWERCLGEALYNLGRFDVSRMNISMSCWNET